MLTQKFSVFHKDGLLAGDFAYHRWHARLIAITNFDDLALFEIHAVEVFDKGGNEVLARLLAVADDINTGPQLIVEAQTQRVLFAVD